MRTLPAGYAERVYAGILGKIIGVYLGRPFEGWSYERITRELGEVAYFVNDRLNRPLVVTDDDISGTFTFLRALEDYGYSPDLTPQQIGQTWLNYLVENKTVLWWGGMGNSTEHTAYLRLKRGMQAPHSGTIETNGKVVAEQIGAQIFVDGWAMLFPGDPERADDFARRAASVSHDGEAIYGAQVIAAMEAMAFVTPDLHALLDEAVRLIPRDSIIARLIADLRAWHTQDGDWHKTRERIAERYGYDRYGGNCQIVPNHALIHLGLLYGDDDFGRSLMITNTSGWDTDCNSGNAGCLLGIKNGLAAFEGGRDWRGPVADRMLLSSADGGRSITDAVVETAHVVRAAHAVRGSRAAAPKGGARFNFALPGSVQGWHAGVFAADGDERLAVVAVINADRSAEGRCLLIAIPALESGLRVRAATPAFIPADALEFGGYGLESAPTLYGGQRVRARLAAGADVPGTVTVRLFTATYGPGGPTPPPSSLRTFGAAVTLRAGETALLEWTLPAGEGAPIYEVGVEIDASGRAGSVLLNWLDWSGTPGVTWEHAQDAPARWWASQRAWVRDLDQFGVRSDALYHLVCNERRGMANTGTRAWTDYRVCATLRPHMARAAGIAARVQGLERYYALLLAPGNALRLIKRLDGERILAESTFPWKFDQPQRMELEVRGPTIVARIDNAALFTCTDTDHALLEGAIGLVAQEGRVDVDRVIVGT